MLGSKIIFFLFLLSMAWHSFAAPNLNNSRAVFSLAAGPIWQQGGKTQHVYLPQGIMQTYVPSQKARAVAEGDFFLGRQWALNRGLDYQLGVDIAMTYNTKLNGAIWNDNIEGFEALYHYQIRHSRITLKTKFLAANHLPIIPWVSMNAGIGFNGTSSYTTHTLHEQTIPLIPFSPESQTTFSYALSAGLQKAISKNWQLGLGYEFADWGKSRLEQDHGPLEQKLILSHLYTNGILFNLTYCGL